jgi:hypothetical protein
MNVRRHLVGVLRDIYLREESDTPLVVCMNSPRKQCQVELSDLFSMKEISYCPVFGFRSCHDKNAARLAIETMTETEA